MQKLPTGLGQAEGSGDRTEVRQALIYCVRVMDS